MDKYGRLIYMLDYFMGGRGSEARRSEANGVGRIVLGGCIDPLGCCFG